jgi:hypothetical protein
MARNTRHPPEKEPRDELRQLALDLTALADGLEEHLARAEKESLSYTDFALVLLGGERQARVTRRRERSLKRLHLGPIEGLDGFDFAVPSWKARTCDRSSFPCVLTSSRSDLKPECLVSGVPHASDSANPSPSLLSPIPEPARLRLFPYRIRPPLRRSRRR